MGERTENNYAHRSTKLVKRKSEVDENESEEDRRLRNKTLYELNVKRLKTEKRKAETKVWRLMLLWQQSHVFSSH